MIFIQNMVFLTGIIGFTLSILFSGMGSHLYFHQAFSYYRKKNVRETYQFLCIKTLCISGALSIIYITLEIAGILEPMGIWGILAIVLMTLLANLLCHGYAFAHRGWTMIIVVLGMLILGICGISILMKGIYTNQHLIEIAGIFLMIDIVVLLVHSYLWKKVDFV